MYELIQVSDICYYIQCPSKIGIVKIGDGEVCLIDSGNNRDAGKKAKKILDDNGWKLTAIYNTHSNADHIGGNRYLKEQTGCRIYCPDINGGFANHTILSPAFLYGGYPCKDLRHKFLLAQESDTEKLCDEVLPEGFKIIWLPGHFFDMAGFMAPDGVAYIADALISRETLEKYQISFLYDPAAYLETLDMVMNMEAKMFIPSHADACTDIAGLARYNISKVWETADKILEICGEPVSFETLLKKLFDGYGLVMNFEQNVLVGSTVRSYLAWLRDEGKIEPSFDGNILKWHIC